MNFLIAPPINCPKIDAIINKGINTDLVFSNKRNAITKGTGECMAINQFTENFRCVLRHMPKGMFINTQNKLISNITR